MNASRILVKGGLASVAILALFFVGAPTVIRAVVSRNEAQAIGDIRTVISAEQTYASVNCGYFGDITRLCRVGEECQGTNIAHYDGEDFLSVELARQSPYEKDGYIRIWTPGPPAPEESNGCKPAPGSVIDYCYTAHPAHRLSGVRSFGGAGAGALAFDPKGTPMPCPLPPFCVVEGTFVDTPAGAVEVERLKVGDAVWGSNDGKRNLNRVVATRRSSAESYLRITFDDGTVLGVTSVHPISTPSGWRSAGALRVGDPVHSETGLMSIQRIESVAETVVVVDITVDPDSSFFANGILVHNKNIEW